MNHADYLFAALLLHKTESVESRGIQKVLRVVQYFGFTMLGATLLPSKGRAICPVCPHDLLT
jgi:hypothetical protein